MVENCDSRLKISEVNTTIKEKKKLNFGILKIIYLIELINMNYILCIKVSIDFIVNHSVCIVSV